VPRETRNIGKALAHHALKPLSIAGVQGRDPTENDAAQREFRKTLGQFATGVTVMTTLSPTTQRVGMTVNSFNSLSLDPPLILWSIARTTPAFGYFRLGDPFAVNVLSQDQEALARQMAQSTEDKFKGVSLHEGHRGVPLLDGCIAHLECDVWARYPGGDHDIVVGHVRRMFNFGKAPLLFHGGAFRSF
jgi:flavin reductase (DIM6/NTAB) family NADH-FMN oxidoreductase RutF